MLLNLALSEMLFSTQVGLASTGHYDMDVYSTSDKSGYYDSIAMAEDEEVGI